MTVSSSPHGEHPGRPGITWDTELVPVEVWVPDHGWKTVSHATAEQLPAEEQAARPNRATRRRLARETRGVRKE
jgi:hypothetical protein